MRGHATAIGGRVSNVGIEDLLAVRSQFGLVTEAARGIVDEVAVALGTWREVARDTGISRAEQDRVAPVIALPTTPVLRRP